MKEEKSTAVISTDGEVIGVEGYDGLPDNFEELSERKQKKLAIAALFELHIAFTTLHAKMEASNREAKSIQALINTSKQMKDLKAAKSGSRDAKKQIEQIGYELNGMLRVIKKLGIDVTKEIKNMKLIEKE